MIVAVFPKTEVHSKKYQDYIVLFLTDFRLKWGCFRPAPEYNYSSLCHAVGPQSPEGNACLVLKAALGFINLLRKDVSVAQSQLPAWTETWNAAKPPRRFWQWFSEGSLRVPHSQRFHVTLNQDHVKMALYQHEKGQTLAVDAKYSHSE